MPLPRGEAQPCSAFHVSHLERTASLLANMSLWCAVGVGGVTAAAGTIMVLLVALPGTSTAQTGPGPEDLEASVAAELHNASMVAQGHLADAEDLKNETVWTVAEPVLDAYGTVIRYWPRSTPHVELAGFNGQMGVPGPPVNPEAFVQPRPQPSDSPPAPPPEDEVRDAVEQVLGNQTNGTMPAPEVVAERGDPDVTQAASVQSSASPVHAANPSPGPNGQAEPAKLPPHETSPSSTTALSSQGRELPKSGLAAFATATLFMAVVAWLFSQTRLVGRLLAGVPGMALFSRQTGAAVLRHPVRSQIHAAISQNAGITSVALSEVTGFEQSMLRYHLAVLCREKLVRVTRRGKIYHYHDVGRLDEEARARECLFWRGRSWLATAILQHPGSSQQDVAQLAGLPASRVCEYTKELAEAGLVRLERVGRCRRYFPTSRLEAMLLTEQLSIP